MSLETFIAARYETGTRQSFSLRLLRWIGTTGIATGVFSLIVVLSIMRGFEQDFKQKILGFQAPLLIEAGEDGTLPPVDVLQTMKGIKAVEPRIEGELVIESSFGTAAGSRIRGIGGAVLQLEGLGELTWGPQGPETLDRTDSQLPGIILGSELADSLQVSPLFHDEVQLVFPFGDLGPSGELLPRIRRFRVVAVFHSGFYEHDHKFGLIAVSEASRLFGSYGRRLQAIYLNNIDSAADQAVRIKKQFPEATWHLSTWVERNQRLFQALQLERIGMLLLLLMLVLIASFSIFALVSMLVLEKVSDMAMLRTIGLRRQQVRGIFLRQVLRLGIRGTLWGGGLGIFICLVLQLFPIPLPPSYYVAFLPVSLDPVIVGLFLLLGPLVSVIAGLYPIRQAGRGTIAEVLRYE